MSRIIPKGQVELQVQVELQILVPYLGASQPFDPRPKTHRIVHELQMFGGWIVFATSGQRRVGPRDESQAPCVHLVVFHHTTTFFRISFCVCF